MQIRRTYHQHCGVARALDVVGERWTLLIVRDLLLGARRYGDLLETLEGITTNLLAKRLREMTRAGLLQKERASPPASGDVYALTPAGRSLEPVVMELGRWGGQLLENPRRGDRRDLGWAVLSLKRRYQGGLDARLELAAGARRFELTFTPERLLVEEKPSELATVRVAAANQDPFFVLFFRGVSSSTLEGRGLVRVEGDHSAWHAMLGALGVPDAGVSGRSS